MNIYLAVLKKYVDFSGRARRSEYWVFALISTLISYGLLFIDFATFGTDIGELGILSSIYSLAVLLPGFAVTVRRLHDTGRSGLWIFILLIPLVGIIVFIVFLATDSQRGPNKYGPYPKDVITEPAS
jgi:uncharacterized membrane protein YhaH (DUF805 family)